MEIVKMLTVVWKILHLKSKANDSEFWLDTVTVIAAYDSIVMTFEIINLLTYLLSKSKQAQLLQR